MPLYIKWLAILSSVFALVIPLGSGTSVEVRSPRSPQTAESDWPMLQHDVKHSGYTSITFVPPDYAGTLNVKWKVGLGERVEAEMQPIVVYGKVYIGVMNGKLHAIDEQTGEIAWTYQAQGGISHTPAAGEGKVFFGTEDHRVYAIDAETGLEAWTYKTDGPVVSSPIVYNQTVYIGSFDHRLYAIDTETGLPRWSYDAGDRVWTSPSLDIANNRLYFGSEQPKAHALDATTGALLWTHQLAGEGMRNTYPTFADNVVIFQTIKPGVSAYRMMEAFPEYIDDPTTLQQYADYYTLYPERRSLFYLNATTGEDMWHGASTSYVPVVIPYWGMLNPVVDTQGYAWIPINSGGSTRNIDLYKVDLSSGDYIKAADRQEFFDRRDETGRFTFANGVYFSTVLSAVGKYDPQSNQETKIFGPYPGSNPFECNNVDPMPVECPYVDRIGGTTGFGGMHRPSALVIANGTGFFSTHGWLYALTPDAVSATKSVDPGKDFTAGPPKKEITYNDLVTELNNRVEQIIAYGHLEPFPYMWNWGESSTKLPPSLWQEGEMVRSLAYTMPYLTQANQDALKQHLKNEVQQYLLDSSQYNYQHQCQLSDSYEVVNCNLWEDECSDDLKSCWYENNENTIAERVYAFYTYAKHTGDWQLIEDNWGFIVARYNYGWVVGGNLWDENLGHAVTRQWLSGVNLDLQTQAASFYAMKEMASHIGDNSLATEAEDRYNQVIQARVYYGNEFIPALYDNGVLTPTTPEEVGNQKIVYPPEGIINRETDVRQVGWRNSERVELRVSGVSPGTIELAPGVYEATVGDYDYPVQYLQMYPEVGEALSLNLQQVTQKYIDAIAFFNPWWYWGDNGHANHKADENLYSKPFMAAALFQAKAYILREDFDTLKDYLPWPVNQAGFRDIYRLQNIVALLAAADPATKSSNASVTNYGQVLTYTISLIGTGRTGSITDTIPAGTTYVPGSAQTDPQQIGSLTDDSNLIHWTGVLTDRANLELSFAVTVTVTEPFTIVNTAFVDTGVENLELSATTIANAFRLYLPILFKRW